MSDYDFEEDEDSLTPQQKRRRDYAEYHEREWDLKREGGDMREFNRERGDSGDLDEVKERDEHITLNFSEIQRMKKERKDIPEDAYTYCYWCKRKFIIMDEFKNDPLSQKEWRISGLCKLCQDAVFTEPKEEE